eukprot:6491641-Amphidinium_carterae.1
MHQHQQVSMLRTHDQYLRHTCLRSLGKTGKDLLQFWGQRMSFTCTPGPLRALSARTVVLVQRYHSLRPNSRERLRVLFGIHVVLKTCTVPESVSGGELVQRRTRLHVNSHAIQ